MNEVKNKIVFSSDADLLQSSLIVFDDNRCLWIDKDEDSDKVIVYSFDLLNKTDLNNSWFNLSDIDSSCDSDYSNGVTDFIALTNDVCWYYGAINFDGTPDVMKFKKFEKFISNLS